MKRTIIIFTCFLLVAIIGGTGCTFYGTGGEECTGTGMRGCGYIFYDCIDCEGKSGQTIAKKGVDYSDPSISIEQRGNQCKLNVYIEAKTAISLDMEICIVQDGVSLYRYTYAGHIGTNGNKTFSITKNISLDNYNENGGSVYYILNRFEAVK